MNVLSSASKSNSLSIDLGLVRRFLPRDFLLVLEDLGEETTGSWGTSGTYEMVDSVDFCRLEEGSSNSEPVLFKVLLKA
ncbi:hypothetical protein Tco_0485683 [Tanacetum coccineum]